MKCKDRTSTVDQTMITIKNNRPAPAGRCAICGTNFLDFYKKRGSDIAAKLAKLPGLPWAKYPGEKHLPGYSYCGPGTRLDIRLDNNDQARPVEELINAIDEACRIHDIADRSGDLQQRHLADVNLIHAINAIPDKSLREKIPSTIIKAAMKGK